MPTLDLPALAKQRKPRTKLITLRTIKPPALRATDLFQAGYAPIIAAWSEGTDAIVAEYERTLAQMTTDAPSDVGVKISAVENGIDGLLLSLRLRVERWARLLESWHRARWSANVLSATGIDLSTIIGPADAQMTVEAAIERNVGLIKSISDQARTRIADAVFRGFQAKTSPREVAGQIREAVAMGRRRALNVAADQNVKLGAALNEQRRRDAGIMAWEWVHSYKLHPRKWHLERNGNLYSDTPEDVGIEYQGKTVMAPPEDKPGQLPFCGCTERAVLILE